jgi:hypothetical protein
MRHRKLLGWILPAIIVTAIVVYVGGVLSGRWPDPTAPTGAGAAVPYPESTDPEQRKARAELCPLVNRPEVLELIERPPTVKGVGTSYLRDADVHQCSVTLRNSTLRLAVAHDRLRIADYQKLFAQARPLTVLGRPALWTTDPSRLLNSTRTVATLLVAWDRADSGGTVELTVIRDALDPGDETALTRIAEGQLAALPGWPG